MKKTMYLLICCLVLSGCATMLQTPNTAIRSSYTGTWSYKDYEVEIISDPPGAKIEWNNAYIGDTPLRQVFSGEQGCYATIIVKANPIYNGQYTQTKILSGNCAIPRKIYFNMHLAPTRSELDVNINN